MANRHYTDDLDAAHAALVAAAKGLGASLASVDGDALETRVAVLLGVFSALARLDAVREQTESLRP